MDAETATAKLTMIQDRERSRRKAVIEWEAAKTLSAEKRRALEKIDDDLHEEITSQQMMMFAPAPEWAPPADEPVTPSPLPAPAADEPAPEPPEAPPAPPTNSYQPPWRSIAVRPEIYKLQNRPWATLKSMKLETLGPLVDYVNAGNELESLPGWSTVAANNLISAIEKWFDSHPDLHSSNES